MKSSIFSSFEEFLAVAASVLDFGRGSWALGRAGPTPFAACHLAPFKLLSLPTGASCCCPCCCLLLLRARQSPKVATRTPDTCLAQSCLSHAPSCSAPLAGRLWHFHVIKCTLGWAKRVVRRCCTWWGNTCGSDWKILWNSSTRLTALATG